jgi:hypothetical protein
MMTVRTATAGVLWMGTIASGQSFVSVGSEKSPVIPAGEDVVAALFWNDFKSAGPTATDQEDDAFDIWVIEDFSIDQGVSLTGFESTGWITSGNVGGVTDVPVRIYDALPWKGGEILVESIEGKGHMEAAQLWGTYFSEFGGDELAPGEYVLAWQVSRSGPAVGLAIIFAAPGEHDVGGGVPDNAYQWNPGGGFGWPGDFQEVPEDLDGTGNIGVNFTLKGGELGCLGDFNGDGTLNVLDFVAFQLAWVAQEPEADCDGSGDFDVLDFVCFQQAFVAGCG